MSVLLVLTIRMADTAKHITTSDNLHHIIIRSSLLNAYPKIAARYSDGNLFIDSKVCVDAVKTLVAYHKFYFTHLFKPHLETLKEANACWKDDKLTNLIKNLKPKKYKSVENFNDPDDYYDYVLNEVKQNPTLKAKCIMQHNVNATQLISCNDVITVHSSWIGEFKFALGFPDHENFMIAWDVDKITESPVKFITIAENLA